jgi:hypothetical protein
MHTNRRFTKLAHFFFDSSFRTLKCHLLNRPLRLGIVSPFHKIINIT